MAQTTQQKFVIYGKFDIPPVRARFRAQLTGAQFSANLVGRAVTAFSGLADALFITNEDQQIEITLRCRPDQNNSMLLTGLVPGAASKLNAITEYTATLQRIVDTFQILPEEGYLRVEVGLSERS